MERMNGLRRTAAIAGAAALLVILAGCSAGLQATAASAVKSSSAPTATLPAPVETTTPTPTPTPVPVPSACIGTPAGVKHIYVSISQQHLWACTGEVLLIDGAVTTGASAITNSHYATPLGNSHINGKSRNTVLAGKDINGAWNDPVQYWMPFNGGIGFHDASWQTFPLGSPLYTTQGSHGCIHVSLAVISTMFDWATVGTLVTIKG